MAARAIEVNFKWRAVERAAADSGRSVAGFRKTADQSLIFGLASGLDGFMKLQRSPLLGDNERVCSVQVIELIRPFLWCFLKEATR